MFKLVKGFKIDSKEFSVRRCLSGSDEKLCLCEKGRLSILNDYMERIMNDENDGNQYVKEDTVRGLGDCVVQTR